MKIALLPIFAAIVTPLTAQQPAINPTVEPPPQIVTSARGEIRCRPRSRNYPDQRSDPCCNSGRGGERERNEAKSCL